MKPLNNKLKEASSFWLGNLSDWRFIRESPEDIVIVTKIIHSIEKMANTLQPAMKIHVRLSSDLKANSEWSQAKVVLPSDYLWKQSSFRSFAHIVDLWTALALHEAGHIILSKRLETVMVEESHEFILIHLVEDFWVENWILDRYPGYKAYFQQFKDFYYSKNIDLGDDIISMKINDLIYHLNSPQYEAVYEGSNKARKLLEKNWDEAKSKEQVEIWDRIKLGRELFHLLFPNGLVSEIKEETSELNLSNPNGLEPTAASTQMKDVDLEVPSPFLLSGKVKKEQSIQFHHQVKDGQKLTWASEQMMETWLKDDERFLQQAKKNSDDTIIKVPDIDSEAIDHYNSSYGRAKPYILKLKKKFELANTPRIYENTHLQQGVLDEVALYRAHYTTNLFKSEVEHFDSVDQWDITLLIDQSKSTSRLYDSSQRLSSLKRYEVATDMAVLFAEAFKNIKPIQLKIYAFSTALHSSTLQLDELLGTHATNSQRIGMIRPKDATPEFLAVKEMTLTMSETGRTEARKLLFIFSDGEPDDYKYGGGSEHSEHIKEWVKKWSKRNFHFVHVALANETNGKDIYPVSIQFEHDYADLIAKVYRFIKATLSK